jgi:hypothetical protein
MDEGPATWASQSSNVEKAVRAVCLPTALMTRLHLLRHPCAVCWLLSPTSSPHTCAAVFNANMIVPAFGVCDHGLHHQRRRSGHRLSFFVTAPAGVSSGMHCALKHDVQNCEAQTTRVV